MVARIQVYFIDTLPARWDDQESCLELSRGNDDVAEGCKVVLTESKEGEGSGLTAEKPVVS